MSKVILITGASSGIGRASAIELIKRGHTVYGGARSTAKLAQISGLKPLKLDMSDYESLTKAANKIIEAEGQIDVLFNNAGYGLYGAVEDVPIEQAKKQFEINLFGLAFLTQLVLPHMRKVKSGTIINTSSMGGKIYTPLGAWYHATKHALEGFSDCLRLELKQFDINVVIIEPGGVQTTWGDKASVNLLKYSGKGVYQNFAQAAVKRTLGSYKTPGKLSSPEVIAQTIVRAVNSDKPKTRYIVGKYAHSLIFLRKYFGDKFYDSIILSTMK